MKGYNLMLLGVLLIVFGIEIVNPWGSLICLAGGLSFGRGLAFAVFR